MILLFNLLTMKLATIKPSLIFKRFSQIISMIKLFFNLISMDYA